MTVTTDFLVNVSFPCVWKQYHDLGCVFVGMIPVVLNMGRAKSNTKCSVKVTEEGINLTGEKPSLLLRSWEITEIKRLQRPLKLSSLALCHLRAVWSRMSRSSTSTAHTEISWLFGKSSFKNKDDWAFAVGSSERCHCLAEDLKPAKSMAFFKCHFNSHPLKNRGFLVFDTPPPPNKNTTCCFFNRIFE